MGIIDPSPDLSALYRDQEKLINLVSIGRIPELQPLIQRANDQYFYWSQLRYRIPAGVKVSAEEVWAYLKLGRNINRKVAPCTDKKGKPFTYWIPDWLHRGISQVDKWSGGTIMTDDSAGLPSKEQ